MVYTYTRTYTKQELEIKELKAVIYDRIKKAVIGKSEDKYLRVLSNGNVSNEVPQNTYYEGILIGDGYTIKKLKGSVDNFGDNLSFEYNDEIGSIVSYGENYASTVVKLGDKEVSLLEFINHPEVEEYINQVTNKIRNKQQVR